MTGNQELTVDEETRRKIQDIEDADNKKAAENGERIKKSIINGNKIMIDFSKLSTDRLEFQVRTGSLIQSRKDVERQNIQELIVPISQCIGALSDANKPSFEQNLMNLMQRLFELSDIDFAKTAGQRIDNKLVVDSLKSIVAQIVDQNKAISQLQQIQMGKLPQENTAQVPQMQQQAGTSQLPPEVMNQLMQGQQAQPQQQAQAIPEAPQQEAAPIQ